MKPSENNPIFVGVEIGTSTIKVMVAEIDETEAMTILGFGEAPSLGMCKGESTNIDLTMEQFQQALEAAEESADIGPLTEFPFFLSLSGSYIESHRISKFVEVNPTQSITQEQIESLHRETCSMVPISQNGQITLGNIVGRCFRLARDRMLFNPAGQFTNTLGLEIEYFTADSDRMNAAISVLSEFIDERQLYTTLYTPLAISAALAPRNFTDDTLPLIIDIGGGMTSIIMPCAIGYMACSQIAVGCEHIANDLSIGLDISISTARRLLRQLNAINCTALAVKDGRARMVNVNEDDSTIARLIPASSIEIIIEERLREILELVRKKLTDSEALHLLGNEILLSGGGALIPRVNELAYQVFNRKIRTARPYSISGNTGILSQPQYNTVIGLIRGGFHDLMVSNEQKSSGGFKQILKIGKNFFHMLSE